MHRGTRQPSRTSRRAFIAACVLVVLGTLAAYGVSVARLTWREPTRGSLVIALQEGMLESWNKGSYTVLGWQWGPRSRRVAFWPRLGRGDVRLLVFEQLGPRSAVSPAPWRLSVPLWLPGTLAMLSVGGVAIARLGWHGAVCRGRRREGRCEACGYEGVGAAGARAGVESMTDASAGRGTVVSVSTVASGGMAGGACCPECGAGV